MRILKRIIYTILGLLLVGVVALVGVILYAEYSGSRFTKETIAALADPNFFDGESRLVYDENGNIAELPGGRTASTAEEAGASDTATDASVNSEQPYVMDLGSALFHTADCPYAANIAADNRSEMTTTREKIINAGYNACTNCNP